MKNIIEVNNLTKKYPGFTLSQASFTVPEGCITGFVGATAQEKPQRCVPSSAFCSLTAEKSVFSASRVPSIPAQLPISKGTCLRPHRRGARCRCFL